MVKRNNQLNNQVLTEERAPMRNSAQVVDAPGN